MGCPKADRAGTKQTELAFPVKAVGSKFVQINYSLEEPLLDGFQFTKMESKQKESK